MTRRLAIIPARGGSKRLPRKNLLPFRGRPIIAHTIAAALTSARFDRIVVSTDDPEIAAAAKAAGAEIHDRDAALATDAARVVDVCLDVLASEERAGRSYDVFSCLYATAPLRSAEDVAAVTDLIDGKAVNFAMAVTTYPLPPHQALRMSHENILAPMWPDLIERRAGDIDPLVVDNGSTYAATVAAFRKHRTFYGPGLRGHLMPRERSVDIDEQADYALACWYAEQLRW